MKNAIVVIDATPFKMWYEAHYALPLGHKKNQKLSEAEEKIINKKSSNKREKKYKKRQKESNVESALEDQLGSGRVVNEWIPKTQIQISSVSKSQIFHQISTSHSIWTHPKRSL